jgi:hypothetical protein
MLAEQDQHAVVVVLVVLRNQQLVLQYAYGTIGTACQRFPNNRT